MPFGGYPPPPTLLMVEGQCRCSMGELERVGHLDWGAVGDQVAEQEEKHQSQALGRFQEQSSICLCDKKHIAHLVVNIS